MGISGFFITKRARRAPDVTSRNARLSRYARATLTDATVTDANDDAFFFISLNHARTRPSVDDASVRSFVRSFDQSISQSAARTRFGFFPGRPSDGCALLLRDATDGRRTRSERRDETEFVLFESVRVVDSFVRRSSFTGPGSGIRFDRSIGRSNARSGSPPPPGREEWSDLYSLLDIQIHGLIANETVII